MNHKFCRGVLAIVFVAMPTAPALAQLTPYSQDFEGLDPANPDALALEGWLVFGNVFDGITGDHLYEYGPFPAPNPGEGFSAIEQCGLDCSCVDQGDQELSVYSDYSNDDQANGHWIEANVFQEQVVGTGDVGKTWSLRFDAKSDFFSFCSTTPIAFIKTLDPSAGHVVTSFRTVVTNNLPVFWTVLRDEDCNIAFDQNGSVIFDWEGSWESLELSIELDAGLAGQILQFGFANTTTAYQPSRVFYDNVTFTDATTGACCTPFDCTEGPVDECVGEYKGHGTTCNEADCAGPLFITLCHIPPGNPGNARTITVGLAASQAHLNHGDAAGPCPSGIAPGIAHELRGESPGDSVSKFESTRRDSGDLSWVSSAGDDNIGINYPTAVRED